MAAEEKTMLGKVCLVTGATSGLGASTAHELARRGATVVIVGRNPEKCAATAAQIQQRTGNAAVDWLQADLSAQQQIRSLARQVEARYPQLHVLVNNAGVIVPRRQESVDGVELTLATNYLSHFLLTNLLLGLLRRSTPARVVNVSSVAHQNAELDFDDLQFHNGYRPFKAYARSKLAILVYTYSLAQQLGGTGITVNAVHPGLVWTNLGRNNGWVGRFGQRLVHLRYHRYSVGPEEGARAIVFLATTPELEGVTGQYFVDQQAVRSSKSSYDPGAAEQLWQASERLTDLDSALH